MLPLKYGVNVNVHGWDYKLLATIITATTLVMQDYCFIDYFAFPYSKVFFFSFKSVYWIKHFWVFFPTISHIFAFLLQLCYSHLICVWGWRRDLSRMLHWNVELHVQGKRVWLVQSVWMDPPQFHSLSITSSAVFVCLQVLNSGPSRSRDTVVGIMLPKILVPYRHRLLQLVDWQVRQQRRGAHHQLHASL